MLSEHDFIKEIEDYIFPLSQVIEERCRLLFNKKYNPGRGPTGYGSNNELDFTINRLESSLSFLKTLKDSFPSLIRK